LGHELINEQNMRQPQIMNSIITGCGSLLAPRMVSQNVLRSSGPSARRCGEGMPSINDGVVRLDADAG